MRKTAQKEGILCSFTQNNTKKETKLHLSQSESDALYGLT